MRQVIRFVAVLALAFWLGGIAFYGGLVIPTAHEVMSSHREIGFVTRAVTGTANLIGLGALVILLVHLLASWRSLGRAGRISLAVSLGVMVVAQAVLFILRTRLDTMLDPGSMQILDRPLFMPLHERYLNVTSILCLAGLAHLWSLLAVPSNEPNPAPPPAP